MKSFVIILKNYPKSEHFGCIAIETGKRLGWETERVDGIDGRLASLVDYNLLTNKSHKKCINLFSKPGVVGCFLSHFTLWQKCLELNEPIAIFEDDVLFLNSPPSELNFIDVVKLDKLKQGKKYAGGDWWEGAHAYILKPSGAKKLIDWSYSNGILPADLMLGTNILNVDFNTDKRVILNPESQIDLANKSLTRNL
jgi:GR25 family glycosyltransferase involved in LPS biosynthesis